METDVLLDKNQVLASLNELPDKVSSEELIERILFIKLIQSRLWEIESEPGTPHEEFMREFDEFKAELKAKKTAVPS